MALPSPLTSVAAVVGPDGISAPTYAQILEFLQTKYRGIFGGDSYIDPDSQDGQLMATFAKGIFDSNMAAIAAYNNFSPASAQRGGLSNVVKINGIRRLSASNSSVDVRLVGRAGTTIPSGIISDANGKHQWQLPANVVIPNTGQIDVTATATDLGAIQALSGTITKIVTPTLGWQSVTNSSDAAPGAAIETDAALRRRQAFSVALPSRTVLQGIRGAVADVTGVSESVVYENSSSATDSRGLPPHSITAVVLGGDALAIATAIRLKKTPGAYTYGDIEVEFVDAVGITETIRFFVPTEIDVLGTITIKALEGYSSAIGTKIKQSVADYINALGIGQAVTLSRLYLPAQLYGAAGIETFQVSSIEIGIVPGPIAAADVAILFNQRAVIDVGAVTLTVT